MSCVCPVYIRHSSGTHFFLSSAVKSYLRSNLTADSRTSPVPAIFHFFILFYYFHLQMFERFINYIVHFHIVCLLRYTTYGAHPAFIRCSSCIHPVLIRHSSCIHPFCILVCILCVCPVYIRHSSGVHPTCSPFYHLRSNLTFGTILPRILEQVLCLRYSTFLSIFITFIYRCSRDL
jgi:hypothetical protein